MQVCLCAVSAVRLPSPLILNSSLYMIYLRQREIKCAWILFKHQLNVRMQQILFDRCSKMAIFNNHSVAFLLQHWKRCFVLSRVQVKSIYNDVNFYYVTVNTVVQVLGCCCWCYSCVAKSVSRIRIFRFQPWFLWWKLATINTWKYRYFFFLEAKKALQHRG